MGFKLYTQSQHKHMQSLIYLRFKNTAFTRDIAETPSKAYTIFDTSPSPLWEMTWIAVAPNDPSGEKVIDSNNEARPMSKKPKRLKANDINILHQVITGTDCKHIKEKNNNSQETASTSANFKNKYKQLYSLTWLTIQWPECVLCYEHTNMYLSVCLSRIWK